jgi:hypothetical protein
MSLEDTGQNSLTPSDDLKESAEKLALFRTEIMALAEEGRNRVPPVEHFVDPRRPALVFNPNDLGLPELELWEAFKACRDKKMPASHCLTKLKVYHDRRKAKEEEDKSYVVPVAQSGLESYVGNHLTEIAGREEIREQLANRREN